MDIKSKKFNDYFGVRLAAFLLCVSLFVTSMLGVIVTMRTASSISYTGGISDLVFGKNYDEVVTPEEEYFRHLHLLLSTVEMEDTAYKNSIENIDGVSYYIVIANEAQARTNMGVYPFSGRSEYTSNNAYIIAVDIASLTYVPNVGSLNANMKYPIYDDAGNIISEYSIETSFNQNNAAADSFSGLSEQMYELDVEQLYVEFDPSFLEYREGLFENGRETLLKYFPLIGACFLLSLVFLIYLMVVTGRKDAKGNRKLYFMDKLFVEVQILIIAICATLGLAGMFMSAEMNVVGFGSSILLSTSLWSTGNLIIAVSGFIVVGVILWCLLSLIRLLKAHRFKDRSLIYIVIRLIWNALKTMFDGTKPMGKVVIIALAICLASASIALAPLVFILVLIFAPKWVRKYEEIKKGVNEVKMGNIEYRIPVDDKDNSEFGKLARGINEISNSANKAMENELKNQRLKTDLISNVSHDLKTPMTSLITYVDLLNMEGIESENAQKYLNILAQKTKHLKQLTDDLFDAAKASSGAIPVRMGKVDLLSLINQGLGEMSEGFEDAGVDINLTALKDKYYVNADGQLLWRVVENLLSNVLKYALEGSRVYIDVFERLDYTILEIKNVSRAPLNVSVDELMERFKRGDESRATPGSGLGLSIARDLTELQEGEFTLSIDGDLFKARVMLNSYEGEPVYDITEDDPESYTEPESESYADPESESYAKPEHGLYTEESEQ